MIFIEVALPIPQFTTFTYKIPEGIYKNLENKELIGRRVLVPFRNTALTGIIVGYGEEIQNIEIRDIIDIPDKETVFTSDYIKIIQDLSDYYVSPVGMFLYYVMPEGLRWKYNPKTKRWQKRGSDYKVYIPNIPTLSDIPALSKKSFHLLEFILENGEVTKEDILEEGFSLNSLKTLLKKNLIKEKNYIYRDISSKSIKQNIKSREIDLQKGFYLYDTDIFKDRIYTYKSIINKSIREGLGSIIVFPNIEAVEKVYRYLKNTYGDKLFIYHDRLSNKEKIKTWFDLKNLKGTVLIGTYSSLFIPVKNLKNIILEEEYSEAYRTKRTPRFDARRVAFQIGKIRGLSVIFGASVPSVESYYARKKGSLKSFNTHNIFSAKKDINISVIPFKSLNQINEILKKEIYKKKKVLIVVNKRGFSSFLYCPSCEIEIVCNHCEVPVKVRKEEKEFLECSICGKKYQYIRSCPDCENILQEIGFGVEKIAEMLKKENIDFSYDSEKSSVVLSVSISGKEAVFPQFDTVINIYPDFYLSLPDFRAEEKYFRNLLLPYFKSKENYILLTNIKNSKALDSFLKKDISIFYNKEIEERALLNLPPLSKFILLSFEKKDLDLETVEKIFSNWINENSIKEITYEGPFYAPIQKIRGKKRVHIILINFQYKEYLKNLYEKVSKKGIKLNIEVDPRDIR